jgi:hypothetical protein
MSLYLAESKGLNRNPDIYEKAGAFRLPRRHHFGAVIAHIAPSKQGQVTGKLGRMTVGEKWGHPVRLVRFYISLNESCFA